MCAPRLIPPQAAAASSPVLERLKSKGYEVLFALDQIDEIALQGVGTYEDMEARRARARRRLSWAAAHSSSDAASGS